MTFMRDLGFQPFSLANEYTPRSYAIRRPEQPVPLVGLPRGPVDVVFLKAEDPVGD